MPITLLELSSGNVSLEFHAGDVGRVKQAIREKFCTAHFEFRVLDADVFFGGCSFLYYFEWENECLISKSKQGDEILKALLLNLSDVEKETHDGIEKTPES